MNMKLHIDRPYVERMVEVFPSLAPLAEQLRFGNKVEVPFDQFSSDELSFLQGLYRDAGPEMQGRFAQLSTLQRALNDKSARFAAEDLEAVLPAVVRYLVADAIRGWMFTASTAGSPLPYVITRLDYTPPSNEETGRVIIEMKANTRGTITSLTLRISAGDIANKTVGEILAAKGFVRETPDLIAAYDEREARYYDWRARYGAQFSGTGIGFYAEDPNSSHRDMDWLRKNVIVLSSSGGAARLVNDEGILIARALTLEVTGDILGQYLRKAARSNLYDGEVEAASSKAAIKKGLFCRVPIHPYLLMFHLELHHYVWVHVDDLMPYAYQPGLKRKLILPEEQTDLIDILTGEMDVLMDDIIAGKSGGTTVLCAGPPGVGKTLTAEVYSEIIKRPLYRVHSGQLGLNVAAMETVLKDTLTRAQRWGAVMLIDEADVYIKRRDDDITMNAVVGVFLRVLEYFNGLLFLTTNRIDDIDEAIVSRCIALIKFNPPDKAVRRKIWSVMTEQFGIAASHELLDQLTELFPAATGRDIKGLAKLAAKFCHHKKVAPSLDVFKRCSIFRGMDPSGKAAFQ